MKLKSSTITKKVNEEKDQDEFSLSLKVIDLDSEDEAEKVRILLKKALIKYGGQSVIDEPDEK